MPELKLTDDAQVPVELDIQESDPEMAEFQRQARAAKEPVLSQLKPGDLFAAFSPFYRMARVKEVGRDKCLCDCWVNQTQERVTHKQEYLGTVPIVRKWQEIWGLKEILVFRWERTNPDADPQRRETHVVVLQENRPENESSASSMVPTRKNSQGQTDGAWCIVHVVPYTEPPKPQEQPQETQDDEAISEPEPEKPRRGRPPGSKNHPKVE